MSSVDPDALAAFDAKIEAAGEGLPMSTFTPEYWAQIDRLVDERLTPLVSLQPWSPLMSSKTDSLDYACSSHSDAPEASCATCQRITRERQIIVKLVDVILAGGYTIGVSDGEEVVVPETANAAAILSAMCSTDMDILRVYAAGTDHRATRRIGSITLIYGNDRDLISDWSWRARDDDPESGAEREKIMAAIGDEASAFAEGLA